MRFAEPGYFYFLWLLALLIVFLVRSHRKKRELLETFLSPSLVPRLVDPLTLKRTKSNVVFSALAVLFLILALTQPRWGYRWEDLKREGVDIVIALDGSMIPPPQHVLNRKQGGSPLKRQPSQMS